MQLRRFLHETRSDQSVQKRNNSFSKKKLRDHCAHSKRRPDVAQPPVIQWRTEAPAIGSSKSFRRAAPVRVFGLGLVKPVACPARPCDLELWIERAVGRPHEQNAVLSVRVRLSRARARRGSNLWSATSHGLNSAGPAPSLPRLSAPYPSPAIIPDACINDTAPIG
jgi:hypothetical protein